MFYEILSDGTIGCSTPYPQSAKKLGLTLETTKEIVYGYNGKRYIQGTEPTPPPPGYSELRMTAYPSFREQLDMLYWDKVNGTSNWQDTITAIKTKYPKE